MEIESIRHRPASELSDKELTEELMDLVTNGIENAVECVLVDRDHAPLTPAEREQVKQV